MCVCVRVWVCVWVCVQVCVQVWVWVWEGGWVEAKTLGFFCLVVSKGCRV